MSLFRRAVRKIGLGLLDLLVLTGGLIYLYFQIMPTGSIVLFTIDAFWLFVIVVGLYLIVVVFVAILLTGMQGTSWFSNVAKSVISTIVVIALFSWVLFPVLWLFGYQLSGSARDVLITVSVIRWLLKIWVVRRLGGAGA